MVFNRTGYAMKIKTSPGAKGYVHNATWENLILHNVDHTIDLTMFYQKDKNETTDLEISNITVRNVTAYGSYNPDTGNKVSPGVLHCQKSSPCHQIRLEDIVHVDVKAPFDCYNAYGTWRNVTPEPCLKKEK